MIEYCRERTAHGKTLAVTFSILADTQYPDSNLIPAMPEKTLFEKIADREIPATLVYEDELCFAFRDINPQAPTHILIVPRKPIPSLDDLINDDKELVGHLFITAKKLAADEGLSKGYRTVFNCGQHGQQTVPHLHLHLLGGRKMTWPPG
jgi:histidine triad (HIT) family protein